MALDGIFLKHIKKEIEKKALGARVDKIYQPSRDELVFFMRTYSETFRLLFSVRPNSARVHFTEFLPENPKQPPMLCMLLRKRLGGARLVNLYQPQLERVLCFEFDAVNEMGDHVSLTLAAEIMGRYSNIILFDADKKIIDALKRVDIEMSEQRPLLPGLQYRFPPSQNKICLLSETPEMILKAIRQLPKDMPLSKAFLSVAQGVSPIVCREAENFTGYGRDVFIREMTERDCERFLFYIRRLQEIAREDFGKPYLVANVDNRQKPIDFSFLPIAQYGTSAIVRESDSFSSLLDAFFAERDRLERMRAKEQDILRLLANTSERLSRKINNQRAELMQCENRDTLRIYADLITANQHRIGKGISSVELENYYEEEMPVVSVPLNPALSASQNAQKYYKEYRKARTAEEKLTVQIKNAESDLLYLDTVLEELSRASSEEDLREIRQELQEQGYLRTKKEGSKQKKQPARRAFKKQVSSDGFDIFIGRNNRENDELTLRQAKKNDLWFHTKDIPGSHVILMLGGREPTQDAIREAAILAAANSKAKDSSQIPVDYTSVRYVSKPQGAKPGMVIYTNQKTIFVTP